MKRSETAASEPSGRGPSDSPPGEDKWMILGHRPIDGPEKGPKDSITSFIGISEPILADGSSRES